MIDKLGDKNMKQNKILQSGRSMVEMLGVLAITGVLSIAIGYLLRIYCGTAWVLIYSICVVHEIICR